MSCESFHADGKPCTMPGRHEQTHGYQTDDGQWVFWEEDVPRVSSRRMPTPQEINDKRRAIVQPIRLYQGGSTLFDPALGQAARDGSIEIVDAAANERWKHDAMRALERVARRREFLSADEILEEMNATSTATTHELRALGPLFLQAAKRGLIVKTNETWNSKIPRRHQRPLAVWRSRIYHSEVDYSTVTQ